MIFGKLMQVVHEMPSVSDVHICLGKPVLLRGPYGYVPLDEDIVDENNIEDFVSNDSVGGGAWNQKMIANGGKLNGPLDLTDSRIRFSIYETDGLHHRTNISMRIIRDGILPLEKLGGCYNLLKDFTSKGKGLLILTGATGSGKTSTMSSVIDRINNERSCHIMTIEDPIERVHVNKKAIISQRELGTNLNSFASGIEGAMRQMPDVLCVGELLDKDTVESLFRAADSGHMVIATTHGRSAKDVLSRMLGFFNPDEREQRRQVLASCLTGVVSQALVPSVDEDAWVLASEVLVNTPAVKANISAGNFTQLPMLMQQGRAEGMNLLGADLMRLVKEKKITMKRAVMAAYEELPIS